MRSTLALLWLSLLASVHPSASAGEALEHRIRLPAPELRPAVVWQLPPAATRTDLASGARQLRDSGFGGALLAVGPRLAGQPTPSGSEWAAAAAQIRQAGLTLWLARYLNASEDGLTADLLQRNPELRARLLRADDRRVVGPGSVEWQLPGTDLVSVVALRLRQDGALLPDTATPLSLPTAGSPLRWQAPEGTWLVMAFRTEPQPALSCLDQAATTALLRQLSTAADVAKAQGLVLSLHDPGGLPWCADLPQDFRLRRGCDLMPLLPALFHYAGPTTPAVRVAYWQTVAELTRERLLAPFQHLAHERKALAGAILPADLMGQVRVTGDPWGCADALDAAWVRCAPGEEQAAGALVRLLACSKQLRGRPHACGLLAECSSATEPGTLCRLAALNAAAGGSLLALAPAGPPSATSSGADFLVRQPYVRHLTGFSALAGRLAAVTSSAERSAQVALVYPSASAQAAQAGGPGGPPEAARWLLAASERLQQNQVDYLTVDEAALQAARIGEGRLLFGNTACRAVLLPGLSALRSSTVPRLQQAVSGGVALVAIGQLPVAVGSDQPLSASPADVLALFGLREPIQVTAEVHERGNVYYIPEELAHLARILRSGPNDLTAYPPAPALAYWRGECDGLSCYLMANTAPWPISTYTTLRVSGQAQVCDPETGTIGPSIGGESRGGTSILPMELEAAQALFVAFSPGAPSLSIVRAPGLSHLKLERLPQGPRIRALARMNGAYSIAVSRSDGASGGSVTLVGRAQVNGLPEPLLLDGPWSFRTDPAASRQPAQITSGLCRMAQHGQDTSEWPRASADTSGWEPVVFGQPVPALAGRWRAHWLTFSGNSEVRFFRRIVSLPVAPSEALASVSADNAFELYINGQRAGSGSDWSHAETFDLKPLLRQGDNVVAVRVLNQDGVAGLLFQARIALPSGEALQVISDGNWRMSAQAGEGWNRLGYDDSSWSQPEVGGTPPVDPWGEIPGLAAEAPTGIATWYRFALPAGARRLRSAGLVNNVRVYVGGQPALIGGGAADLTKAPPARRNEAVLVLPGVVSLPGPLTCECDPGQISVGSWEQQGYRGFHGVGTYSRGLRLPPAYVPEHLFLDLGKVGVSARVWLNGKVVGTRLWSPYTFDLGGRLTGGRNEVRIEVANTLGSERDSGLLGPVRLIPHRDLTINLPIR